MTHATSSSSSRAITPARPALLRFDPFALDTANASLSVDGRTLSLTPKAFAVLEYLARNAGRLVTKDELLDAVWAGVFVGDAALKVAVREVRKVLDDDPKAPRWIETAHRRGYRFIASVTIEDGPGAAPLVSAAIPPAGDAFVAPETRYARSGDVNIAYQVVGDGPIDLVFVMGWVSHLDFFWTEPRFRRFLLRLASFSRLILFDKRGTGLSDRVGELPTLEQRMDDVRAVMDAAGSRRAALLGVSEGGPMCSLFAATYPEKTRALVMIGTYAKRVYDPEYPWAPTPDARARFLEEIRSHWGGPVGIEDRAPSLAHDRAFREWWSTYLRMGASPGAAVALTRMNADIDVRHVLPSIRVPTLILHRTEDRCLRIQEGRYVAERIPGARLVELGGDDHLPFVGDQDSMLDPIEDFLVGAVRSVPADRILATVVAAHVEDVHREPRGDGHARVVEWLAHASREVGWFRGRILDTAPGASLCAAFDGPARAIRCASALAASAPRFGLRCRVGLHTGECDVVSGGLAGVAVDMARTIAVRAGRDEVLVSRTVKDLVAGSGIEFDDRGTHAFPGPGVEWRLFSAQPERVAAELALP